MRLRSRRIIMIRIRMMIKNRRMGRSRMKLMLGGNGIIIGIIIIPLRGNAFTNSGLIRTTGCGKEITERITEGNIQLRFERGTTRTSTVNDKERKEIIIGRCMVYNVIKVQLNVMQLTP